MGKEKDMDKELSEMLRGVPPQNILISFDGTPAKTLEEHAKEQASRQKRRLRDEWER